MRDKRFITVLAGGADRRRGSGLVGLEDRIETFMRADEEPPS